jgi:hypothetical protein
MTTTNTKCTKCGRKGLALVEWAEEPTPEWRCGYHYQNRCGGIVLERTK